MWKWKKQQPTAKTEPTPVRFLGVEDQPFEAPEQFKDPEQWFTGNIISTGQRGQRRHFEMHDIEEGEDLTTIHVRPIKPQGYKGLLLGLILAASWFLVQGIVERLFS